MKSDLDRIGVSLLSQPGVSYRTRGSSRAALPNLCVGIVHFTDKPEEISINIITEICLFATFKY